MRESPPTVEGTEGASLPANLSGSRTASTWPLWKVDLARDPAEGESESVLVHKRTVVKLSGS